MYAIIDPDEKVALDPYEGVIALMDERTHVVNLAPVSESIDRLEAIGMDLQNSLDPSTIPLMSYPNREGIYINLGRVTNFVYGSIAGLVAAAVIIVAMGAVV